MKSSQSVAIVGAGAMGCLFAGRLAEAGVPVTLVDVDEARIDVLNRDGIHLSDEIGTRTIPIVATTAASLAGELHYIILFTKSQHTAAAIHSVAHVVRNDTVAVTLQNGLGNGEAIAEVVPQDHILIGATDYPADLVPPNHVSSGGHGHVWISGLTQTSSRHAATVVDLLTQARLSAVVDPAIEVTIWEKVAFNAALNAVGAVAGLPNGGLRTEAGRRLLSAILAEVVATAQAGGLTLDRRRIEAKIDSALRHHRDHKASMLQDRLAGRLTEIESINGAVVRLGAARGVPTPVTSALADLMRVIEQPGTYDDH